MPPVIIWGDVTPKRFLFAVVFVYLLVPSLIGLLIYQNYDGTEKNQAEKLVRYIQEYDAVTVSYEEARLSLGVNHTATQALWCKRREQMYNIRSIRPNIHSMLPVDIENKVLEIEKEFREDRVAKRC